MDAKIVRTTAAAAAAGLLVAGCSAGSGSGSDSLSGGPKKGTVRVWFMKDSIPQPAQDHLKSQFEKQHPGSTLKIEIQQWDDIVAKLQTAMASEKETPDIVEIGNTTSSTFASIGAFADLSPIYQELGGEKLIPSFVEAGTSGGKKYALPLYGGASVIYYRKDLFEKAHVAQPRTLGELVGAAQKVKAANPDKRRNFQGIYLPASDNHFMEAWIFSQGANYVKRNSDGTWKGTLDTPEAKAGFAMLQQLWKTAALGAQDSSEQGAAPWVPYNNGEVAIMSGRTFAEQNISAKMKKNTAVMAIPPVEPGGVGHSFSGGSSVGISAKSQVKSLSQDALKLIYSKEFQTKVAAQGWIPGNIAYADAVPEGMASGRLQQQIAASSVLTPSAENWAVVQGNNIPADFWAQLARGGSAEKLAKATDGKIEEVLNKK
ncbi:extracellular solute-binding protein [Streptomyces sp. NPDC014735]|uniref:extracellular solute-binding protein n=1 Tax=unclassified Streptomyces TaxID=2593676 RepID=UPI0036FB178E